VVSLKHRQGIRPLRKDSYARLSFFWGFVVKQKTFVRAIIVLTISLAALMFVGLSIALHRSLYSTQSSLTASYITPYANQYWKSVRFNTTQGVELAFFNFAFRWENQSNGPVLMAMQYGAESLQHINLDSAKLTFATSDGLSWPDISFRIPANGLTPQLSRSDLYKVILDYENLGFYGQGTETFDIWFGITVVSGALGTDHSLFLTVDLTGHNPDSYVIGQSYSTEAVFKIVAQPNGLLYVADSAY
jgi:hypothetical protein